jgi:mRNA-degrading endonuclease YafQ of YafQ-DinJ toxin-antitoxin module
MKPTEIQSKDDFILYLQSVIDEKDRTIENQMEQIKKLLGILAKQTPLDSTYPDGDGYWK